MSIPSLTELIPVLQMAIGPVILISGVGLLLLSMTNRLGRVIDRARLLYRELRSEGKVDRDRTRAQLQILTRRATLIRQAIILASVSALLAAFLIISLFLVALLHLDAGWLILLLFIGCLASLIGSLVISIRDINQSLLALKLESGEG
jgi:predicted MFS family arabinose efflux permease